MNSIRLHSVSEKRALTPFGLQQKSHVLHQLAANVNVAKSAETRPGAMDNLIFGGTAFATEPLTLPILMENDTRRCGDYSYSERVMRSRKRL